MMRTSIAGRILSMVLVVATAGCGSSSTPTTPTPTTTNAITAIMDGVAYNSGSITAEIISGALTMSSLNVADTAQLRFFTAARVGTETIGRSSTTGIGYATVNAGLVTAVWAATPTLGSGTLTITTLTATGATGTFAFTASPLSGSATGSKVVTNGTFNVTF